MPQILPLRGFRYADKAGRLADLLAPPYDVISAEDQAALAARSPYNAVHLELAQGGEERYERVRDLLGRWVAEGALQREQEPTLYVYEQGFDEAGRRHSRDALVAGVEAQPWEEGAVKPHEFTMSGPKEDRLKLLRATKTQFSPVFMIARDRAGQLRQFIETAKRAEPVAEATTADGGSHRLWAVEAGRHEMRSLAPLFAESFYIADGHHRYETSVAYRQLLAEAEGTLAPDHPARFAMTAIVASEDPGLVIRPIHRVVPRRAPEGWRERLAGLFEVDTVKEVGSRADQVAELHMLLQKEPGAIVALGLDRGSDHILRLRDGNGLNALLPPGRSARWGGVAPNVLRYGVLEPLWGITDADLEGGLVEYTHDATAAYERIASGNDACGFLLSPVSIADVMAVADGGERLPQKSTFFYPKLGTGLVFHPLEP